MNGAWSTTTRTATLPRQSDSGRADTHRGEVEGDGGEAEDCAEAFLVHQGRAAADLDVGANHGEHGAGTVPAAKGSSSTTENSWRASGHGKGQG
jgi:hypothetical protein